MSIQNINSLIHEIYFIKWGIHRPHWWTRERRCSSQIQENGLKLDITEGGRKHYDIQRWQHLRGGRRGGEGSGSDQDTDRETDRDGNLTRSSQSFRVGAQFLHVNHAVSQLLRAVLHLPNLPLTSPPRSCATFPSPSSKSHSPVQFPGSQSDSRAGK